MNQLHKFPGYIFLRNFGSKVYNINIRPATINANYRPNRLKQRSDRSYCSSTMSEGCCKRMTEEEWKKKLTPEEYHVAREKGTEMAFTGKYVDFKGTGTYHCVGCGTHLFDSDTKYNSGSGWPSFYQANEENIKTETDSTLGMERVEVMCKKCGAHQGHKFPDGPKPTGIRYCINSASINFQPKPAN